MELGMKVYFEATAKVRPDLKNYSSVFDVEIPGWDNPGTFHSVDLWFVFESLAACWRPFTGKHYDMARQICNYVSNCIKSGDPNGLDVDGTPQPEWKPYTQCKAQMYYGDKPQQLEEESISPVVKFLTDFYLPE